MAEWLVGVVGPALGRQGRVGGVGLVVVVRAQGLVGVGGLLGRHGTGTAAVLVVVRGAAGAAAGGKEPEKSGGEGEGDGEPRGSVDVLADGTDDAKGLELLVEEAEDDDEERGRGGRGSSGEEEGDDGDEGGHAAAPAGADGEDADEELDDGGDEGDNVGDGHPLGDLLVDVEGLVHAVGEGVLQTRLLKVPNFHGVEPELGLGLGALGGVVLVVLGDVALAVAPETDVVVVGNGHAELLLNLLESGLDVAIVDVDIGLPQFVERLIDPGLDFRRLGDILQVGLGDC